MFNNFFFLGIENEGFLPNLFYEASLTVLPSLEKDFIKDGIRNQYASWK